VDRKHEVRPLVQHFSHKTVPGWTPLIVILFLERRGADVHSRVLGAYVGEIFWRGRRTADARGFGFVDWNETNGCEEIADCQATVANGPLARMTVAPPFRAHPSRFFWIKERESTVPSKGGGPEHNEFPTEIRWLADPGAI